MPDRRRHYTPAPPVRCARPPIPDEDKVLRLPIDLVLRAVEPYLTPAIQAAAKAEFAPYLGRPQIPMLAMNRVVDFLCERAMSHLPVVEARRLIGANGLALYARTPLIQAMYVALRVASIEWILRSLPRHFSSAQNFGTYEMAEIKPRHWLFTLQDYPCYPSLVQGYFEAGARLLGNDSKYEYTALDSHHCYFDITWERGRLTNEPPIR